MPTATFESRKEDIDNSLRGITVQAEAFGVDTSTDNFKAFAEHMAGVLAASRAENRFLQNIIHKKDFDNAS